jgi:hypothetical protein
MKVPFSHQPRENSTLPLANPNLAIKVITVHDGKGVQKVSNRQVIHPLIGQLPLRQQLLHNFLSLID